MGKVDKVEGQGVGLQAEGPKGVRPKGEKSDKGGRESANAIPPFLLDHPELWQAGQLQRACPTLPSGFPDLDAHLPGGGWPRAGLAEMILPTAGVGELTLLATALAEASVGERWILWIRPPFIPYAPGLRAQGITLERVLIVAPSTHEETLWVLERACRSGSCQAVLAWPDERKLRPKDTRRVQLAAKQGSTFACLFRPPSALDQSSMAELRLAITSADDASIHLEIKKRRGGWPVALEIARPQPSQHEAVARQIEVWRSLRAARRPSANVIDWPSEVAKKPSAVPLETRAH